MRFRHMGYSHLIVAGLCTSLLVVGALSRTTDAANPLADPPAFGLVSLVAGQQLRLNVVCSEHGVGRAAAAPCSGDLMFHDTVGNILVLQQVTLRPGEAASLVFDGFRDISAPVGIDPCWLPTPESAGHAIPSAEVFSADTGQTMLFLNPAVVRLSDLQAAAR